MKENKNIERLFQEKFKDFEVLPPEDSWNLIANKLKKDKQKRRIVPFWYQFSGVAASFVLLSYLSFNFLINESEQDNPNDEKNISLEINSLKSNEKTKETNDYEEEVLVFDTKKQSNEKGLVEILETNQKNAIIVSRDDNQKSANRKLNNKKHHVNKATFNKISSSVSNKDNIIVSTSNTNKKHKEAKLGSNKNAIESTFLIDNLSENNISKINNNQNRDSSFTNQVLVFVDETVSQDSIVLVQISEDINPLEKLLKEKELGKNANEKENTSKWAISSQVSPIYFNTVSRGSSLGEQFMENSKSFVNSTSYGVGASYELSNRITLRSGVNSLAFGYDTNEVIYDMSLRNIDNSSSYITTSSSYSNVVLKSKFSSPGLMTDVGNFKEENIGSLRQNISYIEVPMELIYKVLDKKFGISLIGGMSTLFLNDNSVSLVAEGVQIEIGKANNLNELHFSSNFGLGFKYTFWKSFNANFQPMLKYQINPFSENAGNFKPYFIGLYSGISYQF
ncbi:hypothetical protein [Flavobacterium tibetense]|jgi:hypothetical protein|uniref:Outer membrane protein beta-barrel domain-containing protein n=1 Tax=Flavobacterium tibetense TaxID=2233533 RepID=A0A365P553_9FLAO|nr:hypothetical protein [Flavobacterium tibetense]RBA29749.1 hypothetical protein DPN68_00520 [Flavobacterium tibetense]